MQAICTIVYIPKRGLYRGLLQRGILGAKTKAHVSVIWWEQYPRFGIRVFISKTCSASARGLKRTALSEREKYVEQWPS